MLTGYAIWASASALIKAVAVPFFSSEDKKTINLRSLLTLFPAAVICAGGYYLYEALIYGNFISPLAGIPASLTQSVASAVFFAVAGLSVDKMKLKQKLNRGN